MPPKALLEIVLGSLSVLLMPAEVIGGILLGPSALGHIPGYLKHLFPPSSIPILESTASIGLLFFL
jgi:Kef-type K+ transport system membrane component KefB